MAIKTYAKLRRKRNNENPKSCEKMCIHLKPLEDYLKTQGIVETYRGQVWTKNSREWIYYDAVLNPQELKEKFDFSNSIIIHNYEDIKVGSELGLVCTICNDAIIGQHPNSSLQKNKIPI